MPLSPLSQQVHANWLWSRIVDRLNGVSDDTAHPLAHYAQELERLLEEQQARVPTNCVIKPGLTREGFRNLLRALSRA